MGSSRNKIVLILVAVALIAVTYWLTKTSEKIETAPPATQEVASAESDQDEPQTVTGNQNPSAEPGTGDVAGVDPNQVDPEEGEPFVDAFQKCWAQSPPMGRIGQSTDLKSLMFALERESSDSQTMYENYHVQTPQGDRRLQVLYQENFPIELRLFSVDSEGLPVPERLSNDEMSRPVDEVLKSYLASGTVAAHTAHREINLENGLSAEIETSDDEPVELRLFGLPGGTLSCFKDSCKCITGKYPKADPATISPEE